MDTYNPKRAIPALQEIDRTAPSFSLPREDIPKRVFWVVFSSGVALLLINYLKDSYQLYAVLNVIERAFGLQEKTLATPIIHSDFKRLIEYSWWTGVQWVAYLLVPLLTCRYLKLNYRDLGWRWQDTHKHGTEYVLLAAPIVIFIFFVASHDPALLDYYPFYELCSRSWLDLLLWQCLYLSQFLALEFFFRGYLLNTIRPAIGSSAVWIMLIPYVSIHFNKPWIEATGALFFGFFLALLAIRSRSIWGGFLVHASIALAMDFTALLKTSGLPTTLLP